MNRISLALILIFYTTSAVADWLPDRRRNQFPKEDAYLVVPLPYSYPGVGEGLFLIGNASNVFDTTTDIAYIGVVGDATGNVLHIDEFPLLPDQLLLTVQIRDINRAVVNHYDIRGMNGTGGDDYTLLDSSQADNSVFKIDYTFDSRRYNVFIARTYNEYTLDAILDPDGNSITQLAQPYSSKTHSDTIGFTLDFTDDYLDPRRGIKLGISYIDSPADNANEPDFYVLNYNLLYYWPFREADTLVLNYYQSDAHVRTIGNINPVDIRADLNLNCGADAACLQAEQQLVDSITNARTYGTATSLGGLERLRSYPQGRYQGGHAGFIGAEYRWNLTDEATPFNYLFWKDVRTGKQIAFFAEAGSVSERTSDLWQEQRYTYGVGFRILAASGSVYRADIATGDEGTEFVVFFFYPW
jgi:outer membrane protein assembly factor BamA